MIALGLAVVDPKLLAHSALVTTGIGITLSFLDEHLLAIPLCGADDAGAVGVAGVKLEPDARYRVYQVSCFNAPFGPAQ